MATSATLISSNEPRLTTITLENGGESKNYDTIQDKDNISATETTPKESCSVKKNIETQGVKTTKSVDSISVRTAESSNTINSHMSYIVVENGLSQHVFPSELKRVISQVAQNGKCSTLLWKSPKSCSNSPHQAAPANTANSRRRRKNGLKRKCANITSFPPSFNAPSDICISANSVDYSSSDGENTISSSNSSISFTKQQQQQQLIISKNQHRFKYDSIREAMAHALILVLDRYFRRSGYTVTPREIWPSGNIEKLDRTVSECVFHHRKNRLLHFLLDDQYNMIISKLNGSHFKQKSWLGKNNNGKNLVEPNDLTKSMPDGLDQLNDENEPPITIQRVAEILNSPENYYTQTHKLCNAIEKLLLVGSGGLKRGDETISQQFSESPAGKSEGESPHQKKTKRRLNTPWNLSNSSINNKRNSQSNFSKDVLNQYPILSYLKLAASNVPKEMKSNISSTETTETDTNSPSTCKNETSLKTPIGDMSYEQNENENQNPVSTLTKDYFCEGVGELQDETTQNSKAQSDYFVMDINKKMKEISNSNNGTAANSTGKNGLIDHFDCMLNSTSSSGTKRNTDVEKKNYTSIASLFSYMSSQKLEKGETAQQLDQKPFSSLASTSLKLEGKGKKTPFVSTPSDNKEMTQFNSASSNNEMMREDSFSFPLKYPASTQNQNSSVNLGNTPLHNQNNERVEIKFDLLSSTNPSSSVGPLELDAGRSSASTSSATSDSESLDDGDDSASDRSDESDSLGVQVNESFNAAQIMTLNKLQQQQHQQLRGQLGVSGNTTSFENPADARVNGTSFINATIGDHSTTQQNYNLGQISNAGVAVSNNPLNPPSINGSDFRPPFVLEYQSGDSIDSMIAEDSGESDSSSSDI